MAYEYTIERSKLFTEEGQKLFLRVRDNVQKHLSQSGAVSALKALEGITGDSWQHIACLDRMVELGEIVCLSPNPVWAQHKIYTSVES